jgi:hypothetical protein
MSFDLEQEELQADIDALMNSFAEGDGMTCLSVANVEISGADDGEAI